MLDNNLVEELVARAQRIETGPAGRRVVWHIWGDGPPMILLHGSHGGWMHWVRNIAGLADHWTLYVPDIPGFGESDPPHAEELENPAAHVGMLANGLAELGIENLPVELVGFSLGGLLACWLSLEPQVNIRRVILIDVGGLDTPLRSPDLLGAKGIEGEALREVNRANLAAMMLHDRARIDALAVDIAMAYGRRVRTRVQFQVIPDKLLTILHRVTVPIDLIWGEHDFIHPDPEVQAAAVRIIQPAIQLRIIKGAGHWSMYEQPERFNAALIELLSQPIRWQ